MAELYRRRVGNARPSHLMFTSGVGSLVDLPNFSVLVSGLDDWSSTGQTAVTRPEPRRRPDERDGTRWFMTSGRRSELRILRL